MSRPTAGIGDATVPGGRSARGGKAFAGGLLIVLGILCMVAPKLSGRASVLIFGVLLGLSGLIELVGGAREAGGPRRGVLMGGGVFSLAVGALMVARPLVGMAALTLMLGVFFFAAGLFPLVDALSERGPGWTWEVTFGAICILLGVIVLAGPISSLWLIGTLVGIEIVIRGATLMASTFALGPTGGPSLRPA